MPNYEITREDITKYLATLEPDQTAGTTHYSSQCLVAKALNHKYSRNDFMVSPEEFSTPNQDVPWYDLPLDIASIVKRFDELAEDAEEITRSQVEQAIPELFETQKGN